MKHQRLIARTGLILLAIWLSLGMLALRPSLAAATTLAPASYKTTSGQDGGQPVGNLTVRDQSGTQNDWNKYVEFQTSSGTTYAGYRTYNVPTSIAPTSITAIQVNANYLGSVKATQTWTSSPGAKKGVYGVTEGFHKVSQNPNDKNL